MKIVMCYVDDVVIAPPIKTVPFDRLDDFVDCMKRVGLKCKPLKSENRDVVEAVLTWKAPRTDTQLMSFLGFANFHQEFSKGFADKVYPMQRLRRNKGKSGSLRE